MMVTGRFVELDECRLIAIDEIAQIYESNFRLNKRPSYAIRMKHDIQEQDHLFYVDADDGKQLIKLILQRQDRQDAKQQNAINTATRLLMQMARGIQRISGRV